MKLLLALLLTLKAHGQVAAIDLGAGSKLQSVFFPNQGATSTCSGGAWGNYAFTSAGPANLTAWSSGIVDAKRNRLILKGGGHSDYCGNEIYALTVAANVGTASRLTDPSVWTNDIFTGTGANAFVNPDGTPAPSHAFGSIAPVPDTDQMYFMGPCAIPAGTCRSFTWLFDLSANAWAAKDPVCSGTCVVGGVSRTGFDPTSISPSTSGQMTAYDPVTHTVWVNMITNGYLLQYDAVTNAYYKASQAFQQGQQITYAIDPVRRQMWGAGLQPNSATNLLIGYVDLTGTDSYAFHDVTSSTSGCAGMVNVLAWPANAWPGWVYDPAISRFVGYPNAGNTVYIFDAGTYTCSSQMFGSPSVPNATTQLGTFGKFNYLPGTGQYVIINDTGHDAFAFTLNADSIPGLGSSTITCLDKDGDGYGVGPGCTGVDADDLDSTVHTAAQATTKYGTLTAFLNHLGYTVPSNVWYVAATGTNTNSPAGTCKTITTPCADAAYVASIMAGGDMALIRGGTYQNITMAMPAGSIGAPTIVMGYPGEAAICDNYQGGAGNLHPCYDTSGRSWIVLDGLIASGGQTNAGTITLGSTQNNVIVRNVQASHAHNAPIDGFDGMTDITIENVVLPDPTCGSCDGHNLYMGGRTNPSKNVSIRNFIAYGSNNSSIQWNGRVSNLVIEHGLIYGSADSTGITLYNGVSNSRVVNNQLFDNFSGINNILYNGNCYDGATSTGICPYANSGITFANNTISVGKDPVSGSSAGYGIVVSNRSTGCPNGWVSQAYTIGTTVMYPNTSGSPVYTALNGGTQSQPPSADWTTGAGCTWTKQNNINNNVFSNNIISDDSNSAIVFELCPAGYGITGACGSVDAGDTSLSTAIFTNNLLKTVGSTTEAISTAPVSGGFTSRTIATLTSGPGPQWAAASAGNVVAAPGFVSALANNWATPSLYDLRLTVGSAGVVAGYTPVLISAYDLLGTAFSLPPNMGARTGSVSSAGGSSVGGNAKMGGTSVIH